MRRSHGLNFGLTFAIAGIFIFVGLIVSFLILHLSFTPYQIIQGYLPEGHPDPDVQIPYGGVLAMAPPMFDGIVDYADPETPETVEQYSADVVEFLAWASEPKMEARKNLGIITLGYLLILTGILYWSYREIWSKLDR